MCQARQHNPLETINTVVAEDVEQNPVSYNINTPCQSYERIGYIGLRKSLEKRFSIDGSDALFSPRGIWTLDTPMHLGGFRAERAIIN